MTAKTDVGMQLTEIKRGKLQAKPWSFSPLPLQQPLFEMALIYWHRTLLDILGAGIYVNSDASKK